MSNAVIRDELLRIQSERGALTPEAVVESARHAGSPLHARFEWDDSVAAEKFRKDQARELIRSVRVEFIDARGEPQQVRVFHSVQRPSASRPVYETIENIVMDEIGTAALLRRMDMEWRAMKRRYGQLEGFAKLLQREAAELSQARESQAAAG